jgi:hypothetical protein
MYKLVKTNLDGAITVVHRLSDGAFIPFDPANTDYAKFKKDLADGAELQDADGKVIDGLAYLATLDKEQQ